MILFLNTADKEAEIALFIEGKTTVNSWEAGRDLSAKILKEIDELYKETGKEPKETTAVVVNSGPGSYTGLRIGISVANAFAYGLNIPIFGVAESNRECAIKIAENELKNIKNFQAPVVPNYGSEPNITKPKDK